VTSSDTLRTLRRRTISIAAIVALFALMWGALPAWLLLAVLVDLVARRRFVLTRCVAFFALYLWLEIIAGVLAGLVTWLASGAAFGFGHRRLLAWSYAMQRFWAKTILRGGQLCFHVSIDHEGQDCVKEGPFLLFQRHTSTAEVTLPFTFIGTLWPRYVIKKELLWDPTIDILGQRLPNAYVRRGSGSPEQEIAKVRGLGKDLGPRDMVLIYPEGTRYEASKRERILGKLEGKVSPERMARLRAMTNLMPPRIAGPLSLIEQTGGAVDVVFCAHVGFERAASFDAMWSGRLIGTKVHVKLWRVPAAQVPRDEAAFTDWIDGEFTKMDAWIAERKATV